MASSPPSDRETRNGAAQWVRDTRERVQCVWVRMGPLRAWLRWARGGVRGGGRRGGEEARRRGGEVVRPHTPLCTSSRNANGFHASLRKKEEVRTRYLRDVGTLYGDRGSAVPACGGVG